MPRHLIDIESCLTTKSYRSFIPKFPLSLEARFNEETAQSRIRSFTQMAIAGILLFDIFLATDFILFPADFWRCVTIRLFLFTPAAIFAIILVSRTQSEILRETAKLLVMIITAACALAVGSFHTAESSILTQINFLLVLAFGNLILRPRFPFALALNIIWIAENFSYLAHFAHLAPAYKLSCLFICINFAATTLFAAHQMECSGRKIYLLMLRERIRVMELNEVNRNLAQLSTSDPLTGLANRRQLDRRLSDLWDNRPSDQVTLLSVILADLDHFKRINDTHGHLVGDRILTLVADALRRSVRESDDLIARFGGEEFVIILPNLTETQATRIAERIRYEIKNTVFPAEQGSPLIHLSVSCGVASAPLTDPTTARSLLQQADLALYQAKQSGRDRIATFAPDPAAQLLAN